MLCSLRLHGRVHGLYAVFARDWAVAAPCDAPLLLGASAHGAMAFPWPRFSKRFILHWLSAQPPTHFHHIPALPPTHPRSPSCTA